MKKKRVKLASILSVLLALLVGGVCGCTGVKILLKELDHGMSFGLYFLHLSGIILILYLISLLHIILHEAGHLIFGLLTGYRFVSFRIGRLMLVRDSGRLRLRRFHIVGTGGQCLLEPPACPSEKTPCLWYNLGGVLMNLLCSIAGLIFYLLANNLYPKVFGVSMLMIGLFSALMNGIPMQTGGVANDGYNAFYLKNPETRRTFCQQLIINQKMTMGSRMRELPEEWFPKEIPDSENPLVLAISVMWYDYLMDCHRFDEADTFAGQLCEKQGLLELQRSELLCERMFHELIGHCREETLNELNSKEIQKYRKKTAAYPSRLRLLYAEQKLRNRDEEAASKTRAIFKKAAAAHPFAGDAALEAELLDLIDKRAAESTAQNNGGQL